MRRIVISVYVCLFVCLSARSHISKTKCPNFPNFLCMLPVAVARFCLDGNATYDVFPVLWITSCFHLMQGIQDYAYVSSSSLGGGTGGEVYRVRPHRVVACNRL